MQIQHGHQTSERHTEDRAACRQRHVAVLQGGLARREHKAVFAHAALAGQLHDEPRQRQTHDQTGDRLKDLTDRGGGHVALPLEEAAVGGDHADQQHARRKRRNGCPGVFAVGDKHRKGPAKHQHHEASHDADGEEHIDGGLENAADLRLISERLRLGDHAAHRHGQTRCGDHEQHVVDVVGAVEVAEARRADDVVERGLEQEAHQLDEDRAERQDRRALQKGLFFDRLAAERFTHCASSSVSGPSAFASEKMVGMA